MDRRQLGIVGAAVAMLVAGRSSDLSAVFGRPQATSTQGRGQASGAATPTAARDQATTPQNPTTGTAEIGGTVNLEGNGAPIRRAQITLNAEAIRGQRTLITDDKGHFVFTGLPAGRYTVSANKPGYVAITFGAKSAGRPGTPIQLADGQKFEQASMLMPKGSVLTGTVVDEGNEPTPGTQVRAYRYVLRTGEKTLQSQGTASTDDRGMYRIYGLQPGDYLVSATPRILNLSDMRQAVQSQVEQLLQQAQAANAADPSTRGPGGGRGGGGGGQASTGGGRGGRGQTLIDQANLLQQQLAQQEKEQTLGYAPVYYPGTTNSATATAITLAVSEERAGVDFQLVQVPTAIVAGSLASPDGRVPQGTQITLRPVVAPGMPAVPGLTDQGARVLGDGTFVFSGVAPGQYVVSARATIRDVDPTQATQAPARGRAFGGPTGRGGPGVISTVLWASADVTVNGQNVTGLALALTSGMSVSGRVEFHGTTMAAPTDLSRVRVTITSRDTQSQDFAGGLPPATVDTNGNFVIPGIPPGSYVLRANSPGGGGLRGAAGTSGASGNWTLKSAMVNGRDSLDFPFEVKPGADVTGAVLGFVDKNQTLKGTLQDATGRPTSDYTIIVFAGDKSFWTPQSRRITTTRPGTDGSYTIGGLPPGDYRVTAVTDVEQGEWFDPDFLSQLVTKSIPISITEGETKTQDLKLAGGG
jgi:uncharacterized protein (DUF2141 family)